jgi:hypothetical protein
VLDFAGTFPVKVTLLHESEASMVTPRIRGMQYLLESDPLPTYLVSADADTTFPPTWLATATSLLDQGADLVSSAGYMSSVLWERCPRLTQHYLLHVGSIFFDPITVQHLDLGTRTFPFTEQIFIDFGRPVSDAGFAIRTDCYTQLGGFRQDYWDDDESSPLAAVGWPLMYRAELAGCHVAYMRSPFWSTSPRRLIREPAELFTTKAYLGEIAAFRATSDDQYAWLDHFAERLDLQPLQEYCLKYYIVQRCITRPHLIDRNRHYFPGLEAGIKQAIASWREAIPNPSPRQILNFASDLTEQFADSLLDLLPHNHSPTLDEASSTGQQDAPIPMASQSRGSGTMRSPSSPASTSPTASR